jgi:beta-1,4-mannosyl-glycoprotein beta-1,4-N-acetylglucosaminyltransferase
MKVWSLTPFFNEVEVLEIRLGHLDPYVDVHVIAEANQCYSGRPKPLHMRGQRYRYEPWWNKIIFVPVEDMPDQPNGAYSGPRAMFNPANTERWARENHQRDALMRGCSTLEDDDLVLLSDVDEIPSEWVVEHQIDALKKGYLPLGRVQRVYMPQHVMKLNWRWGDNHVIAICRFMSGATLKKYGPQGARNLETPPMTAANQGWHFSYMGGPDRISYKILNAAHDELAQEQFYDLDKIKQRMEQRKDMFDRYERKPYPVPLRALPEYVQNNVRHFEHLIDMEYA